MKNMSGKINKIVQNYIDSNIEIRKCSSIGIINMRALTRQIAEEKHLKGREEAILSAIRRYNHDIIKKEYCNKYKEIYDILRTANVSTKTKIAIILVKKTDETQKKLRKIYMESENKRDEIICMVECTDYIQLVIGEKYIDEIEKKIDQKDIIAIQKKVILIIVDYTNKKRGIPGIIATLLNEVFMTETNVVSFIAYQYNKDMILIEEKDMEKCLRRILSITS